MLCEAMVSWFDSIRRSYFVEPDSLVSQIRTAQAFAMAIQRVAERDPVHGPTIKQFLISTLGA